MNGIIFDFDGTILDTEQTELAAWQFVYNEYNCILPLEHWHKRIGTDDENFDPILYLEKLIGTQIDAHALTLRRRAKLKTLIADLQPLAGVVDWLIAAKNLGMKIAIASSSPRYWVESHLERTALLKYFDEIVTREDVKTVKPNPEIYLLTLKRLGISPEKTIAIEDSPSGAAAAIAAKIRCLVIPNGVTAKLDFPSEARKIQSLSEFTLHEILHFF